MRVTQLGRARGQAIAAPFVLLRPSVEDIKFPPSFLPSWFVRAKCTFIFFFLSRGLGALYLSAREAILVHHVDEFDCFFPVIYQVAHCSLLAHRTAAKVLVHDVK